jgi:hypothetical protein
MSKRPEQSRLAPPVRELSWTHNLLILSRSKHELPRQFDGALFERVVLSPAKLSAPLRNCIPTPR